MIALVPSAALGQDARAVEMARSLFDAGAQAYSVGKYVAAIKAFEEAYKLTPRPTIAFSMAQAHRRQYVLTKQPENLRGAIQYYRAYIAQVEQGGRVDDAAEALAQLEPMAARLDASAAAGAVQGTPPPVTTKAQMAQLIVSPAVKEAMVSLDGGPASPVPFIKDVEPGPHKLKVTGDGYFDYERDLEIKPGSVVPVLDIALREKPARLLVDCQDGADVSIDGRIAATTPLLDRLDLTAGRHFIAVTKGGHKPVSQEFEVKRGESKTISFKLDTTGQRIASYTMFIGGIVGFVGGVGASILAAGEEGAAREVLEKRTKGNLKNADIEAYTRAKGRRDDFRATGGVLLGAGAVLGAGGLLLYVFDDPPAVRPPLRSDEGPKTPTAPAPTEPSMEMNAGLVWSPGYAGGSIVGRF